MSGSMAREGSTGPDARPQEASVSVPGASVAVALGVAAIAAAVFWVIWTTARFQSRPKAGRSRSVRLLTLDRPFPTEGRIASDPYIGSKVCAECHPGEAALHSRSGHALTLSRAGRRSLGQRLDGTTVADPELP